MYVSDQQSKEECEYIIPASYATFFIPIIFKRSSSPSEVTASTTILAKNSFSPPINFDESVVAAHFSSRDFFSSKLFLSMLTESSFILARACITYNEERKTMTSFKVLQEWKLHN